MDRLTLAMLLVPWVHVGMTSLLWWAFGVRRQMGALRAVVVVAMLVVAVTASLRVGVRPVVLLLGLYPLAVGGVVLATRVGQRWQSRAIFIVWLLLCSYVATVTLLLYPAATVAADGGALWLRYTMADVSLRLAAVWPSEQVVTALTQLQQLTELLSRYLFEVLFGLLWLTLPLWLPRQAPETTLERLDQRRLPPVMLAIVLLIVAVVADGAVAMRLLMLLLAASALGQLLWWAQHRQLVAGPAWVLLTASLCILQWPVATLAVLVVLGLTDQLVSWRAVATLLLHHRLR